jgi:pyruvate/2-oxoacid:ferredoxin oxidoreductase beta subunit/Pyruvate/2-oxoacid:ferredoxin oxidoreductase delta subunit
MTESTANNGNNGHGRLPVSMLANLKPGPGRIAPLTLDVEAYIADFNTTVIDAYRRGVADVELPADAGVARSLMGPGTAGTRDFSNLSPLIPRFVADQCVGCMACVSACPDSAILATAQPKASLATAIDEFAATQANPTLAAETAKAHFVHTAKYGDVPAKRGLESADFGIFIDSYHCKGCAECVDVCLAQGHKALVMEEKIDNEASGECTLDRYRRDVSFFKTLPATPIEYRNEKALADIMLGENAFAFVGGGGSCSGCGEGTAVRMIMAATLQVHGANSMGIVAETGCNTVFASTYPYNPFTVPWTNSLFENGPADALGIRLRWDQAGHPERRLWVFGGDGAMYDIGFQSLSRLVASGADIKVLVLDTGAYSNTGGQASTASFTSQVAKLAAYGKAQHGKSERRKELGRIMMAHGETYVAQVSASNINHFYRAILDANSYPGPAVVIAYAPCMPEHGIADDAANRQAKLAIESRAFPLFTYDPRRGESMAQRLSLQGNPAVKEDWSKNPDGTTFDFTSFARTEGRFAQHFDKEGKPSHEMLASQEDRLSNWRMLQELAGIR